MKHVIWLNRVLKWMKRKPVVLVFHTIAFPLRVVVISDSAFKKVDLSGVACRGHILLVTTQNDSTPGRIGHVIDQFVKR